MRRLTLLGLLAWLGLLSLAAAQGYPDLSDAGLPPPPLPPYPLPHDPALPPQPVTLPAEGPASGNWQYSGFTPGSVAPSATKPTAKNAPTDRIHHLQQAADHLEAAGLVEEASELRKQAAELGSVLAEKLKQLKQLQAEIDRLSKAPLAKSAAHVHLKVRIVQVLPGKLPADRTAVDLIGQVINLSPERAAAQGDAGFAVALGEHRAVERALTELRQSGAIKVLAEPVLITMSGRAASFWMGQERPVVMPVGKNQSAIEFKKAGIQLDVLPVLCDATHVRLEVRPCITTFDEAGAVKIGDHSLPRMRTREIDAVVEIRWGQTLVVGCLAQRPANSKDVRQASTTADKTSEPEIVVLVTPTLLETGTPASVSHGPTAEKPQRSWWDCWRRK